jgi:hypothetical protein
MIISLFMQGTPAQRNGRHAWHAGAAREGGKHGGKRKNEQQHQLRKVNW